MPGFHGTGRLEIGTDDPATAERFYGEVFGWTVSRDDMTSTDLAYRMLTTGDADGLHGGLFATEEPMPGYAIFTILVTDVEDTCRRVEEAGGTVQRPPEVTPAGVTFAHLLDPAGNHFAVFKPPFTPP
jgi:predicted enzyme related to lactoylglutathione lyase